MVLGSALKSIRTIYGMSARELSGELDISPSYLSEIETGKKVPNLQLLEKYSNIFDIRISSLLYFAEELEPQNAITDKRIKLRDKVMVLMQALEHASENDE